ncbi:MAG: two-component regulator propeller domain-containing protein [Saprospiraceae bacterium]
MGYKRTRAILLFLFGYLLSTAQNFYFRQLTSEDGLPSSIVYQIAQDKDGILWMGTESGLCAYDGSEFKYYTVKDGLPNNVVHRLAIDKQGRKWLTTLANQPAVFEDGKASIPPWADTLSLSNFEIAITEDSLMWITSTGVLSKRKNFIRPLVIFSTDGTYREYQDLKQYFLTLVSLDDNVNVYWKGNVGAFIFKRDSLIKMVPNLFKGYPSDCNRLGDGVLCFLAAGHPGAFLFKELSLVDPYQGTLLRRFDGLEKYKFKEEANSLFVDKNQNIWIGLRSGLLFLKNEGDNVYTDHLLLKGVFVNRTFEDDEGNIWITTEGEGCYMLTSTSISTLASITIEDKGTIRSLHTDREGNIYIGYTNGYFEEYNQRFELLHRQQLSSKRIVDLQTDETGIWVGSDLELFRLDKEGKVLFSVPSSHPIKCILPTSDNLFVLSWQIDRVIDQKIIQYPLDFTQRIYASYQKNDTMLWLGSTKGLYSYHIHSHAITLLNEFITTDVRAIVPAADGKWWIATLGQGVLVLDDTKAIQQFNSSSGLLSDICNDLVIDEHFAWVGTNMGVSRIDLETYQIEAFGIEDGLSSREVTFLAKSGDNILAATDKGLNIIPNDIQAYSNPPRLHLGIIRIEGDTIPNADSFTFPYYKNDLFVSFKGISYKSLGNLTYAYKMEGLDANWIETKAPFANWASVPPGKYKLRIKVKGSNAVWSEEQQMAFTFDAPWWEKTWFRIIALSVVVGLIALGFRLVIRNLKTKSDLQAKMQTLQLTALSAQMNPHFMFNALSSIQEFINLNDLDSANLYLSQFASLVRSILNNSTKREISLAEEVEQLQLYLNLENLRFNKTIDYQIVIDKQLERDATYIPSMLVQPMAENAIIHGLFHKKGQRMLNISFNKVDHRTLQCIVQDNGIGREASRKINQNKKYKGDARGLVLTENRLALLNHARKPPIYITFEDLADPDHPEVTGTKVTLLIPFTLV